MPKIGNFDYEILTTDHQPVARNVHILLNNKPFTEDFVKEFIHNLRKEFYKNKCNIYIYDDMSVKDITIKYPLTNSEYLKLADHNIGWSSFDAPEYSFYYPLQDIKYKELGGTNWKKKPIE